MGGLVTAPVLTVVVGAVGTVGIPLGISTVSIRAWMFWGARRSARPPRVPRARVVLSRYGFSSSHL
jgi:hypothetical protein